MKRSVVKAIWMICLFGSIFLGLGIIGNWECDIHNPAYLYVLEALLIVATVAGIGFTED